MNRIFTVLIFVAAHTLCPGQPVLKPSIGITSLPADSDPICTIPTYTGEFDVSGLQAGDTASDFTLYDLNGDSVNLRDELTAGKPVLLISSSYTCPIFRNKIPVINSVVAAYGGQVAVFVVYTVEAHPDIDISPYFGFVNTTQNNIDAGILYRQPTTYGERKDVLSDLLDSIQIDAPVLIDGPCNEWWAHYGPAPNNATLIDTTGIVFSKHGWFDRYPADIFCDLDSLLGNPTNCDNSADGTFELVLTSDTVTYGPAGSALYCTADLINNSTEDVLILVRRIQNQIPPGWASAMCLDICLSSNVDSTSVFVPAGETQEYVMYFFTDSSADTGATSILFRNRKLITNRYIQGFIGMTDVASGVDQSVDPEVTVSPNPATGWIRISSDRAGEFNLIDMSGRLLLKLELPGGQAQVSIEGLGRGCYLWRVSTSEGAMSGVIVSQ
jgi:hypothetical protein